MQRESTYLGTWPKTQATCLKKSRRRYRKLQNIMSKYSSLPDASSCREEGWSGNLVITKMHTGTPLSLSCLDHNLYLWHSCSADSFHGLQVRLSSDS